MRPQIAAPYLAAACSLLGKGQLTAFGLIGARLYGLQVREADSLSREGEDVITKREFTLPEQGTISDRAGRILASNQKITQVMLRFRDYLACPRNAEEFQRGVDPRRSLEAYTSIFNLDSLTELRVNLDLGLALGTIPADFYLRQIARLPDHIQELADFVDTAEQALAEDQPADALLRQKPDYDCQRYIRSRSQLVTARGADMPLVEIATRTQRRYEFTQVQRTRIPEDERGTADCHRGLSLYFPCCRLYQACISRRFVQR